MKNDEPEIKPAYKNPLMEHYECDGQISLFDYEEQMWGRADSRVR